MEKNNTRKRHLTLIPPCSPEQLIGDDTSHDLHHLYNKLKITERRLQLAAEAADTGLWSLDLDTNIFWTNEKIREIFLFHGSGEITWDHFLDKVHPEDRYMIKDVLNRAVHDGQIASVEYRIVLPDGSIRWVISRGALSSRAGNSATCLMGATADITRRKESELATARQLSFEVLLADISADFARFMLPADLDGQIEQALGKILDYFGGDRCGLIRLDLAQRNSRITHAFYRKGLERVPPDADLASLFPWSFGRAGDGVCIHFSDLDELPPEAETDRMSWMAMGVRSSLQVPLPVHEHVCYLILIQSLSRALAWPTETFPRLQIFGEVLTSVIFRKKAMEDLRSSCAEIARLKEQLEVEAGYLRSEIIASQAHDEIVGQSEPIKRVLAMVEQVAPTQSTVLICGETGTGKELIAQEIHNLSLRRDRLMVKVNCASLPSSLIESELFGREKGAYTGALTRQVGRFELADNSTIFLDEIGELSLELQSKLLRVLQEGEFERLGSPKTIRVNVRVIAATNRNLVEEVKNGRFREDLYYRLNVFPMVIPPLRERRDDIPMLVWEFLRELNEKMGKKFSRISKNSMASLQTYSWPGNIRELKNVIEYAAIVSTGDELNVKTPENTGNGSSCMTTLEDLERQHIADVLRQTGFRIKGEGGAAQVLGINPATLYSRMKKLGISPHP